MTLNCIRKSYVTTSAVINMYATKAQFSPIEVLVAMLMTLWEFQNLVPCLAGGNASATCLKMLVLRFSDVQ